MTKHLKMKEFEKDEKKMEIKNPLHLKLMDIGKEYQTSIDCIFHALNEINLEISNGEFISVVGKSGSGKTTLMNLIAGIDRPTSGKILFNNKVINNMNENQISKWRGENVGIVFQFFQLLPTLSIIENVMMPMDFCNTYPFSERKERAFNLLKQVGIADQAFKLPSSLSGGQQQRAAIARSLSNNPPLLLADEPTGNLDTKTSEDVFNIFSELRNEGKTIILVTHDKDLAAQCSRIIKLSDGRIIT